MRSPRCPCATACCLCATAAAAPCSTAFSRRPAARLLTHRLLQLSSRPAVYVTSSGGAIAAGFFFGFFIPLAVVAFGFVLVLKHIMSARQAFFVPDESALKFRKKKKKLRMQRSLSGGSGRSRADTAFDDTVHGGTESLALKCRRRLGGQRQLRWRQRHGRAAAAGEQPRRSLASAPHVQRGQPGQLGPRGVTQAVAQALEALAAALHRKARVWVRPRQGWPLGGAPWLRRQVCGCCSDARAALCGWHAPARRAPPCAHLVLPASNPRAAALWPSTA